MKRTRIACVAAVGWLWACGGGGSDPADVTPDAVEVAPEAGGDEVAGDVPGEAETSDPVPALSGTYDITSTFDLASGLPPSVAAVVNFVLDLFTSPTATVMKLMCDPAVWSNGSGLQDLCEDVFTDPSNPDLQNLTANGEIVKNIVDTLARGMRVAACPYRDTSLCQPDASVFAPPGSNPLQGVEMRSRVTCTKEPGANGWIPAGGCSEEWGVMTASLPGGSAGVPLSTVAGATLSGGIEVQLQGGNLQMAISRHSLGLKLGPLLDYLFEKMLMPAVFGPGTDGLPPVDSFEALIGALLAGRQCLDPRNVSCCEAFAANLSAQAGGTMSASLVEGACDALITQGAPYIRDFLLDLDSSSDGIQLGTPAGAPCEIRDMNLDLRIDALGSATQPCAWEATATVGGTAMSIPATFHGSRR